MARIIVVDDEPDITNLMKRFLENREHEVVEAHNGYECLSKLKGEKYELVLLDVMMPGMDGWEVCKRIKEDPTHGSTLVVFFSAKYDPADRERSFEYAHADGHLSKGLDFKTVAKFIDEILNYGYDSKRIRRYLMNTLEGSL